jgi:signal transduction histidine kinase
MRLRRLAGWALDGLVIALAVAMLVEGAVAPAVDDVLVEGVVAGFAHPADVVFTAGWAAALLLRRRWVWSPVLGPVVLAAHAAVLLRWPNLSGLTMLALILSALVHGVSSASPRALAAAPVWPAALGVLMLTTDYGTSGLSDLFYPGTFMVVALAGGVVLGMASSGRATASARATAAERELAEHLARIAATERAHIAQDLRALIADEIRGIRASAGHTRALLEAGEEAAAHEALLEIEDAGRATLADLRHMLGLLRRDMTDEALHPQPGMSALDGIVERSAYDGVTIRVTHEGDPFALPPGIEVVVYRVVERAAAQAGRAGVDRMDVTVHRAPAAVDVHVRARGLGGFLGEDRLAIRERVALYGGDLVVGTDGEDRDVLQVRLPLQPSAGLPT